tara:strand:- start:313 stop:564 length:252 start_codon:yes stop_codon:yes gene_type:complete
MNDNLENYSLLSKSQNNNLNYKYNQYNNYQSWSNVGRSLIKISSIDENGNTQTINQHTSRIQRLSNPYSTPTDVNLSWVKKLK